MRIVTGRGNKRQDWTISANDVRNRRRDVNALFTHLGLPRITRKPLAMLINDNGKQAP